MTAIKTFFSLYQCTNRDSRDIRFSNTRQMIKRLSGLPFKDRVSANRAIRKTTVTISGLEAY